VDEQWTPEARPHVGMVTPPPFNVPPSAYGGINFGVLVMVSGYEAVYENVLL
jgi:hypothetical protein